MRCFLLGYAFLQMYTTLIRIFERVRTRRRTDMVHKVTEVRLLVLFLTVSKFDLSHQRFAVRARVLM